MIELTRKYGWRYDNEGAFDSEGKFGYQPGFIIDPTGLETMPTPIPFQIPSPTHRLKWVGEGEKIEFLFFSLEEAEEKRNSINNHNYIIVEI